MVLRTLVLGLLVFGPLTAQVAEPVNLARQATASASEDHGPRLAPGCAIDGNTGTRWSGIPGHNHGVWFELDWPEPIALAQVVLQQYDTYVKELDLEVWDASHDAWRTLQHLGDPEHKLPLTVVAEFEPVGTTRLRIANITNGPSFTEVEVYAEPAPPQTVVGADANGNLLGIVCDRWGTAPVVGARIELSAPAAGGAWHGSATSDGRGMFVVAMPLGLRGEVALRTEVHGKVFASRRAAAGLQYGLTPLSFGADVVRLDGPWRFAIDPPAGFELPDFDDSGWGNIEVPGHWEMQGFRSLQGIGGYRRRFDAVPGAGRLYLRCDGVYSGAEVWLNGERIAEHEGGALPFEVDVTEQVHGKDNLLALRVVEHTQTSELLDQMSHYADFPLGGIFRKVTLFRVPDVHVGAMALATRFDAVYVDAAIAGTVSILDQSATALPDAALRLRLLDHDGNEIAATTVSCAVAAWQRTEVTVTLPVPAPRPWNAEQPNLYGLVLELRSDDRVVQTVRQRWGFRQTEVRGAQLLVNGKPVKVRGTCHHDSDPLLGRAVSAELERLDLQLIKAANLNAIRTSHYPPLPELLDAADELGIYVEDEGSFCWTDATDDLRRAPHILQLNCELIARDRGHPSVLLWSLCNESRIGQGLWRSRDWVRQADPSRPVTGTYHRDGDMDVAVRHNPITLQEMADIESKVAVPVIWDECWCVWQDIWGDSDELWLDPGIRDYYITRLPQLYDRFIHSPVVQGTQIWAWSDDIFLLPGAGLEYGRADTAVRHASEQYTLAGRGVVGDAQWGVVDNWRRRKPEFWHLKKLHSPVKVDDAPLPVPTAATLRIGVDNQYDFRDLSELRITWQLGAEKGTARAAVAPHAQGEVVIDCGRVPGSGDLLVLEFREPSGELIDGFRLPIGSAAVPPPPFLPVEPKPLQTYQTRMLNGGTTYVVGNGFELGFGAGSGDLRRGIAFGHALLRRAPQLHLLPTGRPNHPLPALDTWRLSSFDSGQDGPDYHVRIAGEYADFQGSYEYTVEPGGELLARAAFVYRGDDLWVRELGLGFAVSKDADLLRWMRKAEYSLYPEDHIGRAAGETRAFQVHDLALPPQWSWAHDNTEHGCNDFRSTKRRLQWGWIGYPGDGPGILIQSDGSQHLRAMVQDDHIVVYVNDLYDGTGSRYEWTANYGSGRLLTKGTRIESTVRLRLSPGGARERSGK
ncbi:MAG TPA: glycoside hydrolase family 2 TIM barrel-domain containing protein [Planctomycetota bacterium]|nr:glycoside hydrolase family 2 TIM barrel-domain containing protein [Planctomycetota bacterium]